MAIIDFNSTARILAVGAPAGADGESIYQVWLSEGNSGSRADFLASQRGRDGINGAKGVDGAGTIISKVAAARILPSSAVVPDGQFGAVPANPANPAHANLVIGVTALGAEAGSLVTIQSSGDLDGVSGSFGAGDTLFPSTNGTLTRVVPTSGWRQAVGRASSSGRMTVNIGQAYSLPSAVTVLPVSDVGAVTALLIAALTPDVLGPLFLKMGRSFPLLPIDGTVPAAGGLYRRGNDEVYDIVVVEPQL